MKGNQAAVGRCFRTALLAGSAIVLAAGVANAQGSDTLEEIVVTGSRIARSNLTETSPLQVIGSDKIEAQGIINIQDALIQNPTFGTPGFSRTNSNFDIQNSGVATVDLRNLGSSRTLVLVNGRRFVAGIPGSSAVDLNTIPTAMVERVEILTGGSSSVYGSDAVAGVVNFIMKKDFEGVQAEARYGISEESDDIEKVGNVMIGGKIGSRGHALAYFGYTEQGAVYSRNRSRSAIDQQSLGTLTGNPDDAFSVRRPYYSTNPPQGRFVAGNGAGTNFTFDRNNNLLNSFSQNGSDTREADGYNRSAMRTIAIPTTRYVAATNADYEVTDWAKAFVELNYSKTRTQSRLEPFPLATNNVFPSNRWNVQYRNSAGTIIDNPLVPAAIMAAATDRDGDGLKDIQFNRRLSEIDNRGSQNNRETFRAAIGLDGQIPGIERVIPTFSNWRWDTSYVYGQTTQSQTSTGAVNVLNFRQALDVESVGGVLQCRDAVARAQGCVPLNMFGYNTISKAAADYVRADQSRNAVINQKVVQANASGTIFELPAGPVGIAFGYENRLEESDAKNDALTQAGLNGSNKNPNIKGSFRVSEFYGETNVPLLADLPMVKELTANGAIRFADYSTVGNVTSWSAGGDYAPISDVRFRLSYAQSIRAPNIGELYNPGIQTFPTGLIDPCSGVTATTAGQTAATCRSIQSIADRIAAQGSFTPTQSELQGISGFNRGNPNLGEETGKSWTIGTVLTPRFAPDFAFTVDYFNIKIEDAAASVGRQYALDQCYRNGDGKSGMYCSLITRNGDGALQYIDQSSLNVGVVKTTGIDFTATYNLDLEENFNLPGQLGFRAAYTLMLKGYQINVPGEDPDPFVGEIGASKHRANIDVNYAWNDLSLNVTTRYIGPARLENTFLTSNGWPDGKGIGAKIYNDAQIRYRLFDDKLEMFFGVDNIFNTKAPNLVSGLPSSVTGAETDSATYDVIGRGYYGGVKVTF
ncbi:TonB-dependent receptor domain-containing protein [Oleisolibacter albus]|uniref:TonB-dependent receptor domain-containing protein n=1 Tax=Oleisolibacter albus TaxID=2171757 RepID=UPI000DF311C2|nr:TonB-dependent receptor [Oleisolibacter albus]